MSDIKKHQITLKAHPAKTYTYGYDDKGVYCRECECDGWVPLEPHCFNCGELTGDYECCDDYKPAKYYCEIENMWV